MSRSRYNWWPFVKNIIRDYPARKIELRDLRAQPVTASASGMPGGGGSSRSTELAALRCLPQQDQREYDAVDKAVDQTRLLPFGTSRLEVVRLTFWARSHTLEGAASKLHISPRTARRWRYQFMLATAHAYGFLTDDEYREALTDDQHPEK